MGTTYTVLTAFMKKPKTQNIIEGITGTILKSLSIKLVLEKTHN